MRPKYFFSLKKVEKCETSTKEYEIYIYIYITNDIGKVRTLKIIEDAVNNTCFWIQNLLV